MARREYQDPPLKRTAGAAPRWYIRVRKRVIVGREVKRQQVREYLGECSEVGIREANRLRAEKLREINGNIYALKSDTPLNDFILKFNVTHIPTLSAGTQNKYRIHITKHIAPKFGKWRLSEIGTEDIQAFLNEKDREGLSWWTRNDIRNILSCIFTCATLWGYCERNYANPVGGVKLGRMTEKREKRLLTDDQTRIVISELPADLSLCIRLADTGGLRVSELLGLKGRYVDLFTGWIQVKERFYRGDQNVPKTKKSIRNVYMGDLLGEMREHFSRHSIGPDDYVFRQADGSPYDDRNVNQHQLRKIAKRHGFYFQGFGFHSFRRGFVTGMQAVGGSSIEVQKMAGHSSTAMTGEYTVIQKDRVRELVEKRQNRLKTPELCANSVAAN